MTTPTSGPDQSPGGSQVGKDVAQAKGIHHGLADVLVAVDREGLTEEVDRRRSLRRGAPRGGRHCSDPIPHLRDRPRPRRRSR